MSLIKPHGVISSSSDFQGCTTIGERFMVKLKCQSDYPTKKNQFIYIHKFIYLDGDLCPSVLWYL